MRCNCLKLISKLFELYERMSNFDKTNDNTFIESYPILKQIIFNEFFQK